MQQMLDKCKQQAKARKTAADLCQILLSIYLGELLQDVAARCRHLGYFHGATEHILGAQRRQKLHVELRKGER